MSRRLCLERCRPASTCGLTPSRLGPYISLGAGRERSGSACGRLTFLLFRASLRPRFPVPRRFLDGRGAAMARWRRLPALGGLGELRLRRAALHFLSAAVLVPGCGARLCSCRGSAVPATFIFLCLVLAGVSMFRLARAWLSPAGTIAATVLYVANPYQLVLVYYRSDFAELLAAALFPLAIHYAIRWPRVTTAKRLPGV